jgi:hypothetical protein
MTVNAKVASAYVDLVARTEAFHKALGDATAATKKWSAEMREEAEKSRESIRLLSEEIGLGIPRGLQKIISELPGLSAALNFAFDGVVILTMIKLTVEAGEKLAEFVKKNEEAARKAAEAWRGVEQPLRTTNLELQLTNDRLENAIAKLRNEPQNGIKEAIDEAIISAGKLGDKLADDAKKIADVLEKQEVGFWGRVTGNEGDADVTERAQELQPKLASIQTANQNFDFSGMDDKAVAQKRKEFADTYQKALDVEIRWASLQLDDAKEAQRQHDVFGQAEADQGKRIGSLNEYMTGLVQMRQFNSLSQTSSEDEGALAKAKAQEEAFRAQEEDFFRNRSENYRVYTAQIKEATQALWDNTIKSFADGQRDIAESYKRDEEGQRRNAESFFKLQAQKIEAIDQVAKSEERAAGIQAQLEQGQIKRDSAAGVIGPHEAAVLVAAAHVEEYTTKLKALETQLAELNKLSVNDANGISYDPAIAKKQFDIKSEMDSLGLSERISVLDDAVNQFKTTFKGAIDSIFDEVMVKSQQTTNQIREIVTHLIDSLNSEMAKSLTGQKTDYRKVFQGAAESFAKTGLEKAEGLGVQMLATTGLGKMLGLDKHGKADGYHMWMDNLPQGPATGATASGGSGSSAGKVIDSIGGGLMGMLNDSNWASSLFGGKLFGAGSFFGGGHALGGAVAAGVPIDVGELGRERFVPQVPGRIVPNRELGGGAPSIGYIDARGTDPALSRANFERALSQTHRQAVHDASRAMTERNRRVAH